MSWSAKDEDKLIWRLQRQLPLYAHCRPSLLGFLRARIGNVSIAPRLKITGVFRADCAGGIICKIVLDDGLAQQQVFVAPLEDLAIDRRHPIAQEIATRKPRRSWRGKTVGE